MMPAAPPTEAVPEAQEEGAELTLEGIGERLGLTREGDPGPPSARTAASPVVVQDRAVARLQRLPDLARGQEQLADAVAVPSYPLPRLPVRRGGAGARGVGPGEGL